MFRFLFGFRGRIGRRQFLAGIAVPVALVSGSVWLFVKTSWFTGFHLLPVLLLGLISATALQIKRFHDRNRSGWRVWVFCILAVSSIVFPVALVPLCLLCIEHAVELLVIAGTDGPNYYGPARTAGPSTPATT